MLVCLKKLRVPNSQHMSAPRRGRLIRPCRGLGKGPFSQFCRRFWWHGLPEFRLRPCHMRSHACQVLWLHEAHIARYLCVSVCVCFSLCAACSGTGSGMHRGKARGRREGGSNFLSVRALPVQVCKEISPEELCSLPLSGCFRPTRLAARSAWTWVRTPCVAVLVCSMSSASKERGSPGGLRPQESGPRAREPRGHRAAISGPPADPGPSAAALAPGRAAPRPGMLWSSFTAE